LIRLVLLRGALCFTLLLSLLTLRILLVVARLLFRLAFVSLFLILLANFLPATSTPLCARDINGAK